MAHVNNFVHESVVDKFFIILIIDFESGVRGPGRLNPEQYIVVPFDTETIGTGGVIPSWFSLHIIVLAPGLACVAVRMRWRTVL